MKTSIGKGTDSEGKIVSEIVTGIYEEKYEIDSKNITSADTKYFLVEIL